VSSEGETQSPDVPSVNSVKSVWGVPVPGLRPFFARVKADFCPGIGQFLPGLTPPLNQGIRTRVNG